MNQRSISDSITALARDGLRCPRCGVGARLGNGSCVSCLLRAGLEDEAGEEPATCDPIEVRDTDWRLGNYQILEEIGRGGMGVIYRARQRHSKRVVALKRVLSYHGDSRETLERFRREAEAAASLDHPNILPIYEVGEADGLPYFTMKYATGGSLQQAAAGLSAEPRECVRLLAKIARAVGYAHREGILHRDLKPGNILLDARGEPMVSDFGLAKWIDANTDLTRSLTIFGTPGYIAPEQAQGPAAALKPTADVYSLGAILFDLLTGRPPFLGEHALAVIHQAAEKPAPKLRSLIPKADRDLETICAKCLEREPHLRYRAAAGLAQDLERWLEGRPIVARPVSPPVKIWRWAKRNPVLACALGACLVLGTASAVWQVQQQRMAAELNTQQAEAQSIVLLPFLDLDSAAPDLELHRLVAAHLKAEMQNIGPSKISVMEAPPKRWTGIGTREEVHEVTRERHCRFALGGTIRHMSGALRVSLHLMKGDDSGLVKNWVLSTASPDGFEMALREQRLGRAIFADLRPNRKSDSVPRERDPGLQNDTTRELITAGRWLIDRGRASTTDLDRAIQCLESAVQMEPESASARAYLAMACLGRHVNATSPDLAERALREAERAVALAPLDESANRALRVVLATEGHYGQALEQGLASLQAGGQSERTFGHIAYLRNVLGRPDHAIKWYARAKGAGQQLADYESLLGDCWLGVGDLEAARESYESAMRLRSDLPDGAVGLARLRFFSGDQNGARTICRQAVVDYPNSPHPKRMLAQIEFLSRNFSEGELLFEELLKVDPSGGATGEFYGAIDYRSALWRLKMDRSEPEAAENFAALCRGEAEAQVARAPQDPIARYRLAAVESLDGQAITALQHLRRAFEMGWTDFRSTERDPRFDAISGTQEFKELLKNTAARMSAFASLPRPIADTNHRKER